MTKAHKPGKKRTTIYLPEELIWKLKEVAAKKRIASDTLAIETAVSEWVASNEDRDSKPGINPKKGGVGSR